MSLLLQQPGWVGTAMVLVLGVSIIVGLAAGAARLTRSAVWQRTFWQVSIVGILALLLAETTGTSAGLVQWLRAGGELRAFAVRPRREPERTQSRQDAPSPAGSPTAGDAALLADEKVAVTDSRVERRSPPSKLPQHDGPAPPPGRGSRGGSLNWESAPADEHDRSPLLQTRPLGGDESGVPSAGSSRLVAHVHTLVGSRSSSLGAVKQTAPADTFDGAAAEFGDLLSTKRVAYGLAWVWIAGSVALLLRMAWVRWLLLRFRRGRAACADYRLQRRADTLAPKLGVRRRVSVFEASGLATPIAFGCLRPTIVVPATFLEDFDGSQQEAMLAHELAHLAAGDPAWQMLADLTSVILWWHPLVWWVRRQWRLAGEMAADEACLLVSQRPDALAACLVLLARRLDCRRQLAGMAMAGPGFRSALGKRVERLLATPAPASRRPSRARTRLFTATFPVALFLVAVSGTAWARAQVPFLEGATTMRVFLDSWRQSLAAATLAAILTPAAGHTVQTFAAESPQPKPAAASEGRGEKPAARKESADQTSAARERRAEGPRSEAREGQKASTGRGDPEAQLRQMIERRRQLQEEAAMLRRRLEAMKPEQEELERIEIQLRQLPQPDAAKPGGPMRDRDRRAQVQAQFQDITAAMQRAREAGKPEEVERLERQLLDDIRAQVQAQFQDITAAMQRAREAGKPEEVERLERQLLDLRLQWRFLGDAELPGRPFEGGDVQRRLQHVRMAVENLHAAGLHAQAEAVAREAERLIREQPMPGMPGAPLGKPSAPSAGRPQLEGAGPPPPPQHLERAVDELREQMQQMQRQMEEMRQHLRTMAERSQKDNGDHGPIVTPRP